MGEFLMPSLGADMDAGTVLEWRIHPGDEVHRGDIVAVVDTEKSDIEVEVFEDGVVEALLVEVGEEVAVGTPLARLGPIGATAGPVPEPVDSEPAPVRAADGARVRSSPLARRRAAEAGVDLATVAGTGPGGAVVAGDLSKPGPRPPISAPAPAPVSEQTEPTEPTTSAPTGRSTQDRQAAMRHAIGDLMARSKREIPHYQLVTTIDLSTAMAWLQAENEQRSVTARLLPAALLLKATALAAAEVPALNGFWEDDRFRPADGVHLGIAVSLRGGGLVAPAMHHTDQLSLDEVMSGLKDLVERARAGRLRSSEMADPTLTVTNLGDQGAEEVYGVIYPPQVALVGFGRVVERPWASGGMIGVRPTVRATLAADHRASDGHTGSRLLAVLDRLLQRPEDL